MDENEELLEFFKALSDPNRLKIIGLLSERPLTGEQMAEMLHLRPSTVSNHLSYLARVGLVEARAESYYNIYSLKFDRMDELGKRMQRPETYPSMASEVDVEAYDRKVLADYTLPDGSLKTIPAQRKKLEVILRHIARDFEPGVRYSEKQVNEMLARYHSDTAILRRELVGYKLLIRQGGGGEYWREAAS
jgi:predicted transcriptional regulator